jgi:hypothetical protein
MVARHLTEEGYALREPIRQDGPVYFAIVERDAQRYCLMMDAFNETILQKFDYAPTGLRPEIADSPGPGFPGYPPVPDGRYASGCQVAPVLQPPPPSPPPPLLPPRPIPHRRLHIAPYPAHRPKRRALRRRPVPSCGPVVKPQIDTPPFRAEPDGKGLSVQAGTGGICLKAPA